MPPLAILAGLGSVVPERILTNQDLEAMVDTSDAWIVERTGIKERRLAAPGEATSDLAVEAARRALADARLAPDDVDLIMVATATPDMLFPSTACLVQEALGIRRAAAFDLSAACSGFIYGLALAEGVIASGQSKTALVIGAETLSRITDYRDRSTCVLFGDGAGAAVVRRPKPGQPPGPGQTRPPETGLLSVFLGADGSAANILSLPAGGSRLPASLETVTGGLHYIHMDGPEVFKFAVRAMVRAVRECLRAASLTLAEVDLLVPHQANARIVDTAVRLLRIPRHKVFHTIESYGNMSSASIPVSLDAARRQGRLRPGDTVVLVAFGAGMTYAGAALRWDEAARGGSAA
jgi:3-oxoacyl-[acyl-carrier-protein] synthase-3